MENIFKIGGLEYQATEHFLVRFKERVNTVVNLENMKPSSLSKWMRKSIEISRKKSVGIIIKHKFVDEKYFYNKNNDFIMVVGVNKETNEFSVLITIYRGIDCSWFDIKNMSLFVEEVQNKKIRTKKRGKKHGRGKGKKR